METHVGVDLCVALSIMLPDMFKLRRLPESGDTPIQISEPFVQSRISGADVADVAFEVLNINRVETDDGGVQAYVRFGNLFSEIERSRVLGQMGFGAVKRVEQGSKGFLVGLLGSVD